VHFALEVKPLDMPLDDLLDAECRVPFDLGTAPLIRAKLLQVTENTGYLVITLPHIISDAWSLGVVARDLTKLYGQEKNSLAIFPDRAECEVLSTEASRWSSDQGQGLASQLSYWRAVLATELPQFEWLRGSPDPLAGGGRTYTFGIGNDTATAVDVLARKLGCTAFVVFLTAFELLISRLSHSEDVVVGIPLRTRKADAESVIGLLAHPVPLRSTVNSALSFADLVAQTREKVLEAMANQEVPFTRILDFAQAKSGRQFLLPVMFTMIEGPASAGDGIHLRPFAYRFGCGGTEAFLTLDAGEGKVQGVLAYDSSTVPLSRAQLFCSNYLSQLEACVAAPMLPMCDLAMPRLEPENTVNGETGCTIALTSTFTAHAIEATLRLWLESMHLPVTYRITPGGEMLQQLLDPKSELARSGASFHVHLVRLSDLYANDRTIAHEPATEIAAAIKAFSNRSKAPAVICICPSQTLEAGARQLQLTEAERKLKNHFIGCNNLTVLTQEEVLASYPISDIFDSLTDRLAQLPYSRDYFAALSSMIMRRAYMWHHTPAKAIIVDADGTLWEGACSEDGPLGLSIGDGHLALQKFLVAQSKTGCLLCLCSRNRDDDIKAAFAAHPEMPLQLQNFVARRVNHEPKSENLRLLASQLNIALTECLFVDDDPVECAEVRANCPEALVLHLQPLQSSQSLQRVWELDRGSITSEDQQRTTFYTAEAVREHAHKEAISLQSFFDSLELELDIEPMAAEHVARVSQLTFRTNQFNCTGARLTEAELTSLTEQANQGRVRGLVVHARDRFGDYGLIGALAYRFDAGEMRVDWWSLSCRVLNRGVEHRILAYLGRCAVEGNASSLTVNFQESGKNIRAGAFLSCGSKHVAFADGRSHFVWGARDASECRFSISEQPREGSTSSVASGKGTRVGGSIWKNAVAPKELQILDAAGIVRAAARLQAQNKERPSPLDRPQTPTQARLVRIWADLLGVDDLGVNETLYSAGGQSLIAIQMLSRIREDFGIELPLMSVFTEDLTVATLAQVVDDALIAHADEADLLNEISELSHLSDHEVSALLGAETVK
jgi:FkbH-like protein